MTTRFVELNLNPQPRTLRQFGFIAFAGFGALAVCARFGLLMFAHGLGAWRDPVSFALAAAGVVAATCSLLRPALNAPLWVLLSLLGYPIGIVVSYALMVVLFFFVFAPIGVLLRALGKDPLQRGFAAEAKTYWTKVDRLPGKARYFRQF